MKRSECAKARREAEEKAAGTCKVLQAGIDTLVLNSRGELHPDLVKVLLALKETAVKQARDGLPLPVWRSNAASLDLEVQPYASKKGSLVLESEALALVLSPTGPRNLPRAYVELRSTFLWSAGWRRAADAAVELLREVSEAPASVDAQVSRIDLAVDFMGWQPTPEMLEHVVGRVVRRNQNFERAADVPGRKKRGADDDPWFELHGIGRRFTGFTFGGGQLLARLYDKTVEIRKHGKAWFEPLWVSKGLGYVDAETSGNVWRLEFQIRREPLRKAELVTHEMKVGGDLGSTELKSWAQVRDGVNELWRYLTSSWLTYRLTRAANERIRLHPRWRVLVAATFVDQPFGELYRHQRLWNMNRCLGALAGYAARELPLEWKERGLSPSEHRFEADMELLVKKMLHHYEQRHEGEKLYDSARARWQQHRRLEQLFSGGSSASRKKSTAA